MSNEGECVLMRQNFVESVLNAVMASNDEKRICYGTFANGGIALGNVFVFTNMLS